MVNVLMTHRAIKFVTMSLSGGYITTMKFRYPRVALIR